MTKAILFDSDGTLVDSLPSFVKAYNDALKAINFNFDERKIALTCFNKKEDEICSSLGVPEKTDVFRQEYFNAIKKYSLQSVLFEDTLKTLILLKNKGIKNIIVTFAYRWYINERIKQYNLTDYIDLIISSNDVKKAKPNPEAVFKVLKILNLKSEEIIVVGDSTNDILMGKGAKAKTVLFLPESNKMYYDIDGLKKTKPDYIISKLNDLIKIV